MKSRKHVGSSFCTLMKQSKQTYYTKYFENNWNNIKNT